MTLSCPAVIFGAGKLGQRVAKAGLQQVTVLKTVLKEEHLPGRSISFTC
jgi:hypothetical protein